MFVGGCVFYAVANEVANFIKNISVVVLKNYSGVECLYSQRRILNLFYLQILM